ncbi:MAG: hypothetical protein Tp178MES00d2C33159851_72 [Prokaryotic dsDNA virus sp.]|nr:MAG: hypothetical protein Tp178MES00d2C33159851_72 [Prokaryotic dsDNA virus sp.]|tara:strand:- start:59133 stop:59780 length:648 start_codon:yes stop_codon:yes gene_type:complete
MGTLNNAVFAYTKIQQADFKYGSNTEKEFSVDCIVDKATAKAWNKQFPKQKAKEIDNDDFERIFKIAPPFAGDEQFVIKLKKPAQYKKDGEIHPVPDQYRPRVFEKGEDGKLVDITKDKLVSNGSKGVASYEENTNDFGTFARLKAIRVDELIEYKKAGGAASYDELGEVSSLASDFSDVPEREMSEVQQEQRKSEPSKAKSEPAADPFDDDAPF